MSAPNVLSVAVIVGVIALCEGMAGVLPALGSPWVPFAVVALGALVKALQVVLLDRRQQIKPTVADAPSAFVRWLAG